MGTINDRIQEVVNELYDGNRSLFCRACDLSTGTLSGILGLRKSKPSSDVLNKISSEILLKGISPQWLLTGEGEKYTSRDLSCPPECTIRLLPISAMGGSLNDFFVGVKDSDCERIVSPIRGVDFAITVTGESMAPEYPSGSQVLIKRINESAFIEWGRVYVLDTVNGTIIKVVTESGEGGTVLCTSIHPDQTRYAPFAVRKTDIRGMYRVLLCMSMK